MKPQQTTADWEQIALTDWDTLLTPEPSGSLALPLP